MGSHITVTMSLLEEALAANSKAAEQVKAGKEKAINAIVGYIMQRDKNRPAQVVLDEVRVRLGLEPITAKKRDEKQQKVEQELQERENERRKPQYIESRFYEGYETAGGRWEQYGGPAICHITGGLNFYKEGTLISVHFAIEETCTPESRKILYDRGVPKEFVKYHYELFVYLDDNKQLRYNKLPEGEC